MSTNEAVHRIFSFMRKAFSDILWTMDGVDGVDGVMKQAITDAFRLEQLDKCVLRGLYVRYFGVKARKEGKGEAAKHATMLVEACYIRVLYERDEGRKVMLTSVEDLIKEFPELSTIPRPGELNLLLSFRNAVKVSLLLVDPYRNRDKLWELASRLENSGNEYHRGSGQREEVKWREIIFEKLLDGTSGKKISRPNQYIIKKRKLEQAQALAAAQGGPRTDLQTGPQIGLQAGPQTTYPRSFQQGGFQPGFQCGFQCGFQGGFQGGFPANTQQQAGFQAGTQAGYQPGPHYAPVSTSMSLPSIPPYSYTSIPCSFNQRQVAPITSAEFPLNSYQQRGQVAQPQRLNTQISAGEHTNFTPPMIHTLSNNSDLITPKCGAATDFKVEPREEPQAGSKADPKANPTKASITSNEEDGVLQALLDMRNSKTIVETIGK